MAQQPARFTLPGDPGSRPWGTMTGTVVRDGRPMIVTTVMPEGIPVARLTQPEAMRAAAFMGWGKRLRTVHANKAATFGAWVTAHHAGTPDPDPTPDPTPTPEPERTPDPIPTPTPTPDGSTVVPVTTDGVPGYMTPAEIVAAGGGATGEPQYTRITVTIPGRDDIDLPDLHHPVLPDILRVIAAAETVPHLRNVWLSGPAGTGKSTIPMQAAKALGLECRSISCGPDDSTAKWFGYQDANGNYHGTAFRAAYEGGGVFIIDEIDASDPGILTALNQALAAEWYEFPDGKVDRHPSLRVIATANTWGNGATREYVGRQEIDAATLDRFGTAWFVGYDAEIDRRTVMQYATTPALRDVLERWLAYCLAIREKAQANRIKVIVSPRRMGAGAGMIAAGFTPQDALRRTFFTEGLSEDVIATITPEGVRL